MYFNAFVHLFFFLSVKMTLIPILTITTLANAIYGYPSDGQFIGLGYNILFGNPDGGDLAHVGIDPGIKSTRHILTTTNETDGFVVTDGKTSCDPHNTTTVFYGGKSYQLYLLGDMVTSGHNLMKLKFFVFVLFCFCFCFCFF